MWRLIRAEFDYRKWQLLWMLGIVIVPLTIIVAFVTQDFKLYEMMIPTFIMGIYLFPTFMVTWGFERTETNESRLRLLGILPVSRRDIGRYRLVFLLVVWAIIGVYYFLMNQFVTINGIRLSPVFILSLFMFMAFLNLGQMFFYEFKRLPPVPHWICRIGTVIIWTGWLMYLFHQESALKLFSSLWWLVIFGVQAAVIYFVTQALFIRRKTLYS